VGSLGPSYVLLWVSGWKSIIFITTGFSDSIDIYLWTQHWTVKWRHFINRLKENVSVLRVPLKLGWRNKHRHLNRQIQILSVWLGLWSFLFDVRNSGKIPLFGTVSIIRRFRVTVCILYLNITRYLCATTNIF
jgi:hypothetical protein